MTARTRVVITGAGIVSSLGNQVEDYWQKLLSGESVVAEVPSEWSQYYESASKHWAPLPTPQFSSYGLSRADLLSRDRTVLNAIVAGDEAISSAGFSKRLRNSKEKKYHLEGVDSERAGIFVGTGLGCITSTLECYVPHLLSNASDVFDTPSDNQAVLEVRSNLSENPRVPAVASIKTMANGIGASLAIRYGFTGPVETCMTACAAGTTAISRAVESIRSGRLSLALCGGSEYYGDRAGGVFMAFDRLRTLAHGDQIGNRLNRPFDQERNGFLFSQGGACFLIVESLERAQLRNVEPLAEIVGIYSTTDANSLAMMSPTDNAIKTAIWGALRDAGLEPSKIGYINAHGTGTEQNDRVESEIIYEIFGESPLVNSTKSLLGHTIGASGAIEALTTALSIRDGLVHPSLNIETPVSTLNFATKIQSTPLSYALTQNFAFGGHNVALVLAKPD